jgi:serine/threonine protein kinase
MLTLNPGDLFAEHYKLVRLVDTGGFAEVWEAIFLSAGNTVALKIYPKLDAEGVKNIEDEYINQADLSHSNLLIARYFGKYNGYPFLEMRYCSGGNASAKLGSATEEDIAHCMSQIASALAYLHANGIVHQDVKPNNFLLDSRGNYYLADLGLSLKIRSTIRKYTQSRNSKADSIHAGLTPPAYRGPELYDRSAGVGAGPVMASDIWALGASLYEMMTGDVPLGEFGGLMQLNQPEPPDLPEGFSAMLNQIIKKCLARQTWDRPKAAELHLWAQHYLDTGKYNAPFDPATIPGPPPPKPGETIPDQPTNTDPGKTILGPSTSIDPAHTTVPGKQKRSVSRYVVLVAIIIGALIGTKWGVDHFSTPNKQDALLPSDTSDAHKPRQITPPAGPDSARIEDSTRKANAARIADSIRRAKEIQDSIRMARANIVLNPRIGQRPKTGYIDIIRIEKTKTQLNITFRIKKFPNMTTISIYGPENRDKCFYVQAAGIDYFMLAVDKKGEKMPIPPDGCTFTASFPKPPAHVSSINVWEGKDQDNPDLNYWNFHDVSITN